MTRLFRPPVPVLAAVLFALPPLGGCRTPEPPAAPGFVEVREAARRQLTEVRGREILRRMGARLAAAEEYRAELTGLIDSFPAKGGVPCYPNDAGYDPRYRYGIEAIVYARLLLLRPPSLPAEEFMAPIARAEIDFEVLEKLCRLDCLRSGGYGPHLSSKPSLRDLELELRIAAGLSDEALRNFDYSTLPSAGETPPPAAAEPVGAEPLRVARLLFDLPGRIATAPGSVPAGEPERLIALESGLLRRLAAEEARHAADPKNFTAPADALLARRLAEGRLAQLDALEQAFRDR